MGLVNALTSWAKGEKPWIPLPSPADPGSEYPVRFNKYSQVPTPLIGETMDQEDEGSRLCDVSSQTQSDSSVPQFPHL